jgi:phage repressor protein C with HTH and peptisase S24 domain
MPHECGQMTALSSATCPLSFSQQADDNPQMSNAMHDRIRQQIEQKELSLEAAAKAAGLDRGYFQKMFERPNASPRGETLTKIAAALGVTVEWLVTGNDSPAAPAIKSDVRPATAPIPRHVEMAKDVPVLGTAAGSHLRGAFQIESSIIDYVRRPPSLAAARDIYALYVEGTSMEPQFNPGDLVYIHPHKPPRIGDAIVVQARNAEHDPVEATIGVFMGRSTEFVSIGKHNPKAKVDLPRQFVMAIHKVLTNNELYGI